MTEPIRLSSDATRISIVSQELAQVTDGAVSLRREIVELEARLSRVLLNNDVVEKSCEPDTKEEQLPNVPLAVDLREIRIEIDGCRSIVHDLLTRLEL